MRTGRNPNPEEAKSILHEMLFRPIRQRAMTQRQLADCLNLSPQVICNKFKHRQHWTPTDLNRFADYFGRNADERKTLRRALHRLAARADGWNV